MRGGREKERRQRDGEEAEGRRGRENERRERGKGQREGEREAGSIEICCLREEHF
jgi:hypothetical protein